MVAMTKIDENLKIRPRAWSQWPKSMKKLKIRPMMQSRWLKPIGRLKTNQGHGCNDQN